MHTENVVVHKNVVFELLLYIYKLIYSKTS